MICNGHIFFDRITENTMIIIIITKVLCLNRFGGLHEFYLMVSPSSLKHSPLIPISLIPSQLYQPEFLIAKNQKVCIRTFSSLNKYKRKVKLLDTINSFQEAKLSQQILEHCAFTSRV